MNHVLTNFKQPPIRSERHLSLVRWLGCCVPGCRRRFTSVHAHHVRRASSSGTGVKPCDSFAVGLCFWHHQEVHQHGEVTCCAKWGIHLLATAQRIAAASRLLGILPPLQETL